MGLLVLIPFKVFLRTHCLLQPSQRSRPMRAVSAKNATLKEASSGSDGGDDHGEEDEIGIDDDDDDDFVL